MAIYESDVFMAIEILGSRIPVWIPKKLHHQFKKTSLSLSKDLITTTVYLN